MFLQVNLKPSAEEEMEIDDEPPLLSNYNLCDNDDLRKYEVAVKDYVTKHPKRREPPPAPDILMPSPENYDLNNEEEVKIFQDEIELWNAVAEDFKALHGVDVPLLNAKGERVANDAYDQHSNGYKEISMGSQKLPDAPSSITEDYGYLDVDDDVSFIYLFYNSI